MNIQQFSDFDVINTLVGPMRVGDMVKKLDSWENDQEIGCSREFYLGNVMVRRDVSIQLKTLPAATAEVGGWKQRMTSGLKRQLVLGKRAVRGVRGLF